MKKRMMMLLTTVALVMGLTACGDSIASTGNDDYVAPSLVVEGTAEPTPEATPEPTAEPAPEYTEVTVRDICLWKSSDGSNTTVTIDGELADTSLTLAEMYFHVPEGMSVTWEDIDANRNILFGVSRYNIPGGEHFMNDVSDRARNYLEDPADNEYAFKEEYAGHFNQGMSKERWESMFSFTREQMEMEGVKYWRNVINVKTTVEEQQALFVEIVNNYTYTEALEILTEAQNWATVSDEYLKYIFLADSMHDQLISFKETIESGFEAYTADPTGWVDTYAEFKQQ